MWGVWVALVLAGTAVAEPSAAEKEAYDLFKQGVELSKQQRWSEALALFEQSVALVERPPTHFNIGMSLVHLKRFSDAISAFERCVALADPERDKLLIRAAKRSISETKRAVEVQLAEVEQSRSSTVGLTVALIGADDLAHDELAHADPPASSRAEPEVESSDRTILIVALVVVAVGSAIALGFALQSGESDPLPGSSGVVLSGLRLDH